MKARRYVEACGVVVCHTDEGPLVIPVVPGILKHPTTEQLFDLLRDVVVARKYTHEALRRAPWRALRAFPHTWLVTCLAGANVPVGRRRALEFMLRIDGRRRA
jgi:hypothetical protein